jgi:hypothetical protein
MFSLFHLPLLNISVDNILLGDFHLHHPL